MPDGLRHLQPSAREPRRSYRCGSNPRHPRQPVTLQSVDLFLLSPVSPLSLVKGVKILWKTFMCALAPPPLGPQRD